MELSTPTTKTGYDAILSAISDLKECKHITIAEKDRLYRFVDPGKLTIDDFAFIAEMMVKHRNSIHLANFCNSSLGIPYREENRNDGMHHIAAAHESNRRPLLAPGNFAMVDVSKEDPLRNFFKSIGVTFTNTDPVFSTSIPLKKSKRSPKKKATRRRH